MRIRAWLGSAVVGVVFVGLLAASPAMAGLGTASSSGKNLTVRAESRKLSYPGEPVEWRRNYIFIRIADPAAVATYHYLGYDPNNPDGIDVTGMYRVIDVYGGRFHDGKGCIMGRTAPPLNIDTPSVAFCKFEGVEKISIKTGNGNDAVKLERLDPAGAVPASVSSTISTGNGHDGVWGGDGPDKIKTGGDNDGGFEDTLTQQPENVDGWGGNDSIDLGNSDRPYQIDFDPVFAWQNAYGGDGNDKIVAKGIENHLYGEAGDDILMGGKAFDTLVGGTGADVMKAGLGDDTIDASETPAQADLLIDCGKDGGVLTLDVGIDPPGANCT